MSKGGGVRARVVPVALTAMVLAASAGLVAQRVADPELRAAFLFNFAKFIEWPDDAPYIRICSTDAQVLDAVTEMTANRTVNGRMLTTSRVTAPADAVGCSVLHVGGPKVKQIEAILAAIEDQPVLTVGDSESFTRAGGLAHFFVDHGRMRFAMRVKALRQVGLRADVGLLAVAVVLRDHAPEYRR